MQILCSVCFNLVFAKQLEAWFRVYLLEATWILFSTFTSCLFTLLFFSCSGTATYLFIINIFYLSVAWGRIFSYLCNPQRTRCGLFFEGFGNRLVRSGRFKDWRMGGLKKTSNKYCGIRKCFYLCSPKQNGGIKTRLMRDALSQTNKRFETELSG